MVRELLAVAEQKYDLDFPLADLFYWGTDKADLEDIKSSTYVGPSWVGGAACDHYAFRQQGVDWQLWIERGEAPLPASWSSRPPTTTPSRSTPPR